MFAGEGIVIVGEVFPLIPSRVSTSARDNVVVTFGLTIEVVGVLIVRFVVEGDTITQTRSESHLLDRSNVHVSGTINVYATVA